MVLLRGLLQRRAEQQHLHGTRHNLPWVRAWACRPCRNRGGCETFPGGIGPYCAQPRLKGRWLSLAPPVHLRPKGSPRPPQDTPGCRLTPLFTGVRGRGQPVEKVGVGPVGGPREPENKAKTLRKRRIQPLNRGQKRARRGFSTG